VIAVSESGEFPAIVEVSVSRESLEEFIRSEKLITPDPPVESGSAVSLSSNPV
jgi:hypothetical protein